MTGQELFDLKKENLELIEAFEFYSLYYDIADKTLWFWNGQDFFGMDVSDFYEDLYKYI
ncbi:hypothetical protein [Oceanobacillus sp. Castelsardo]|uniref:hypothetical protein n=1 Tax=Oceanobacillus sp. Castelsardo TaxID=1851204 RepID=UPI0012E8E6C6|nr:hypothetical protein [Oceanobacillus sp. Castelsardo]